MTPTKTPPYKLPPALESPDVVTSIRAYGCPGEHPLPITQLISFVGTSGTCDVRLESEYISQKHCAIVRSEQRLRVEDLESHNGTFFRGRREAAFEIAPGDTFSAATTRLLALNEPMRFARPVLTEVLGWDREGAIDDVVINSVLDTPILVLGPRGAGQSKLARAIHDMSIRRNQSFIEVCGRPETTERRQQLIDEARRGTLVLAVNGEAIDPALLDAVLSTDHGSRLVLLAPSLQAGMRSVKLSRIAPMSRIDIRPLCERPAEIPRLLELELARNGLCARLADLRPENQQRLLRHNWPYNLEELRQIAAIIAAVQRHGSTRKAAAILKLPRSTMQYWLKRFQLTLPPMTVARSLPLRETAAPRAPTLARGI